MMAGALLEVAGLGKRFGGFVALDGIDLDRRRGRARRPDRAQRLRQVDAGQLHLRHARQRDRQRCASTAQAIDGLLAHERTRRGMARSFQLPRPFASLTVADNLRVPLLYTVNARPGHSAVGRPRSTRAAPSCCARWRSPTRRRKLPRDLTQVEMRKLELARAMAAEPKLLIADEAMAGLSQSEVDDIVALLIRLNERGITIILIEHIMRAVMSFSQRLVVLVSGKKIADGKPDDGHPRPRGGEGLPWPIASPSRRSTPPTARCACSRTCRSRVNGGETVVLLGTNGNGKSTLDEMRHGHRARRAPAASSPRSTARRTTWSAARTEEIVDLGIALVPEGRRLFPRLTVEENLLLGAFRKQGARADQDQSAISASNASRGWPSGARSSPAP